MLPLDLNLIWGGVSISFWSTFLIPIMALQLPGKSDQDQLSYALYGMTAFGFGEVFGGFFHVLIIDKIGAKRTVFVNIFILLLVLAATEATLYINDYNWVTFLACFMWGYEDGMTNIFLFQILGNEFEHGGDPFGVFNIIQGLSVFGLDLTAGKWIDITDRTELMWYAGGVLGFGIIANAVSYTFDFKREKKKLLTDSNIY